MSLTGLAHSEIEVINRSVIVGTGLRGIIGVQGPTDMGPINTPMLVGSWSEFKRIFGGLITTDDFPLYCRRMLEAGAKLRVNRLGHYTTIGDATTLVGVKATITAGSGGNTAVFTAKNIGTWANGAVVTITAAASGLAGRVDIKFTFADANMNQTIYNVKNTAMTATDKELFNVASQYIDIGATAGTLAPGTATLASGTYVVGAIVAADYTGDVVGKNGWHAFDEIVDIIKLCAPSKADPAIDLSLSVYVDSRPDIMGLVRTPIGLSDAVAVEYREATGAYAGGTALDNWRMGMFTGGLRVLNPETQVPLDLSEIGDAAACFSRRDNNDPDQFKAAAGPKRGRIKNTLGVLFNVGTPARQTNGDNLIAHGINPVILHQQYGPVLWGNKTLTKTYAGTLLEGFNVAELIVQIYREIKPLIDFELFDPNDPITWKNIYRKVRELMNVVQEKRGVYGWVYQGDQDVDDITQIVINTPNDVAAGRYVFHLYFKPIRAMEYIGAKFIVDNNNVDYEALLTQPDAQP